MSKNDNNTNVETLKELITEQLKSKTPDNNTPDKKTFKEKGIALCAASQGGPANKIADSLIMKSTTKRYVVLVKGKIDQNLIFKKWISPDYGFETKSMNGVAIPSASNLAILLALPPDDDSFELIEVREV